jgi:hypothetical protein
MRFAQTHLRQWAIGLLVLVLAFFFISLRFPLVQNAQEITKRTFENRIPAHVPLEIKIKKIKEQKVLDARNKDWYRDFEMEVKTHLTSPSTFSQ